MTRKRRAPTQIAAPDTVDQPDRRDLDHARSDHAVSLQRFALTVDVDGTTHTVPLADDHAARKATHWAAGNETVDFTFASTAWGYLVEPGNSVNFAHVQPSRVIPVTGNASLACKLRGTHTGSAGVALYLIACDSTGNVLDRHKIALAEHGIGAGVVILPPDASHLTVALRLSGTGRLSNLALDISPYRSAAKSNPPSATPDSVPNPTVTSITDQCIDPAHTNTTLSPTISAASEPLNRAADLIKERNYRSALDLLAKQPPSDLVDRLIIRAHAALHDFDTVKACYRRMTPAGQTDAGARLCYLRALANTRAVDEVRQAILAWTVSPGLTARSATFLPLVYPFAVYVGDDLADLVLSRMIGSLDLFERKQLPGLLRCAHDLLDAKRWIDFWRVHTKLAVIAKGAADKAKLDILAAHASYVVGRHDIVLAHLNTAFARSGNAALLSAGQGPLRFADLSIAEPKVEPVGGPLVTIIMSCFNSAATLPYAIGSLLAQTYRDIEVLVVDDAGSDDTAAVVRKLAKADQRVTYLRQPHNGGTYVCRNRALQQARGDFVTCQDSDDWAHPQKIQRLVETLQVDPNLVAAAVQHVRYDPDRGFRGLGGYVRFDASSMMYRRQTVLDRVGYFDSVRVGGDSEYQFRVERAFGKAAVKVRDDLLSLVLWSETSLSGGGQFAIDDDAGIFTPFRNAYRSALAKWQETTHNLYIDFPLLTRPFDVPSEGLPDRGQSPPPTRRRRTTKTKTKSKPKS